MTDMTDQDRRQLRDDAKAVINKTAMRSSAAVSIAQYVLATVDAPAPTLADDLREFAKWVENPIWRETKAKVESMADRAEQIEQERDEARAEVERLTATFKEHLKEPGHLPNPADVKPGEAWLVECRGERRNALKDNTFDIQWTTVNADGWPVVEDNEDVMLIARLVPDTRHVIYRPDELDKLPRKSVILDKNGISSQKTPSGNWECGRDVETARDFLTLYGPVTVIHVPEVTESH